MVAAMQAWSNTNQFVISQEPYPSCQIRTVLTARFDCIIWLSTLMFALNVSISLTLLLSICWVKIQFFTSFEIRLQLGSFFSGMITLGNNLNNNYYR